MENRILNSRFYVVCLHFEVEDQRKTGVAAQACSLTQRPHAALSVQQNPCILKCKSGETLTSSEVTCAKHMGLAGTPRGPDVHRLINPLKLRLGRHTKREPCVETLTGKKPASWHPNLEKKLFCSNFKCWKLVI